MKDLIQSNKSYELNEDVAHCFSVSYFRAEHYSDADKWYATAARLAKRKGKSGAKFSFLAKHYQQHAEKASELQKEIENHAVEVNTYLHPLLGSLVSRLSILLVM